MLVCSVLPKSLALTDLSWRRVPDVRLKIALAPLPIPFPRSADWRRQRQSERALQSRAIVLPSMILSPSRMNGIGRQVLRADVMVLPINHPAKAG